MNVETRLDERLWRAIQSTYSSRNFTGPILDAIYFLSDLIREKTGLQSDGVALVGQAFGGKSPRLKVNKLQTESEINLQSGVEQLLRGLFQAVRNPRSHEKYTDKQDDADAIILFVNYLIGIIDKSKTPFTKTELLARVFDKNFVEKQRYAQLLVEEIPPKQRLEVMLDVLRDKESGEGKKLNYFTTALLLKMDEQERVEVYRAISDELKVAENDATVRTILQMFPADIQDKFDEAARLRMENRLIRSVDEGRFVVETEQCSSGALGTWAMRRCRHFLLKDELVSTLIGKLGSDDAKQHAYVFQFFWEDLTELDKPASARLIFTIKKKLRAGNKAFYERLILERLSGNSEWVEPFKKEMDSFKEVEQTPGIDDDLPF